ncbi:MAG: restriction endonuclease subunit S [Lactobacillus delbrueckii]|nr:restriction endonuclease subunit S [Lactobacillus delbrueckii]
MPGHAGTGGRDVIFAWEQCKLGDVFSFLKNSTLSRSELNYESGKFKYIHYGDILTKFGDITDTRNFSVPFVTTPEKVIRLEKYFLQNGDVVIADTAEDSMVGKVTEIQNPDPFPTVSGLHTIPIRPNKEFAAGFLGHYMNAPFYHDQLFKLMQGVKVLSLSKSAVIQTKINSPSYCEQRLISRMINLIDGTITLHEEKKRQLERLKSALLQKMFADKSGYPAIRFEGFDKAWEERKLKELGDIQTGNTPPTSDSDNYSLDGVLWVTPTDIKSLVISNTAKKLSQVGVTKARIAKAGSILVTSIASIGKNTLLRMDAGFNQQINSLTPTSENDSYFLLTQSEKWSEKMKQIAASATMQIVNKTEFSNISTYVPVHKEEQEKIGSFFKHLDDTIALHQQKINNINSVKKSLLQKMFI